MLTGAGGIGLTTPYRFIDCPLDGNKAPPEHIQLSCSRPVQFFMRWETSTHNAALFLNRDNRFVRENLSRSRPSPKDIFIRVVVEALSLLVQGDSIRRRSLWMLEEIIAKVAVVSNFA
jgi:hypothetical protein